MIQVVAVGAQAVLLIVVVMAGDTLIGMDLLDVFHPYSRFLCFWWRVGASFHFVQRYACWCSRCVVLTH